ncbi:NAD-dependent epimerase/dehydratase family protein [Desulfosarcina ovata]|uniref:NAD dependent epimerase/dehydratase n=1 Tax=Desulfosarcina ovata subsp. ovata TaxID=2752305 RepID=A0A5K8A518_9BACT|nr:NAD-dependent epimerase/dehydratase family protein [Desulfosarcina ovata]BBO87642.1 NAD dependent epimerase/dehydratase [Desulfosarcina ovata subsp. ovata]
MNNNEILITGAAGFIGSALVERLSSTYRMICLDQCKPPLKNENSVWESIDITNMEAISLLFKIYTPDIVIHCAGIAHQKVGSVDKTAYMHVNSEATKKIASLAAVNNNLHFIFLSTISVYGETDLIQPVCEDSKYNPSSDYALSKLDAEYRLIDLYEKGLIHKLTILRLSPVYDKNFRLNLERRIFGPKKIFYVMFGNGQQTMSALAKPNILDFIEYTLQIRDDDRSLDIINMSDDCPYSFYDIIQVFKKNKIYSYKPVIPMPLSMVWLLTRLAGIFFRKQKLWFHSCYSKVANSLVFDNTRMLQTGFKHKHNLSSVLSNNS